MAFANYHTGILTSPKHLALSDSAFRLWSNGKLWCKEHLTDGFIPESILPLLHRRAKKFAAELVTTPVPNKSPLWARVEGGYQMHEYSIWDETKKAVETRRSTWAERQARRRDKQRDSREAHSGVTRGVTRDKQRDSRWSHADVERRTENGDDDSAQARVPIGESSSSEMWTAGQLRTSVLELLDLWRQHGTGAPTPAFAALSGSERRTLRDALKRRSLSEWEATFRRAKASAYLAGRDGTHAPMSLWRVLERASAIESGEFDPRPVSGPREVPPSSRPELRDVSADIAAVQREQALAAQERAARKAAAAGGVA